MTKLRSLKPLALKNKMLLLVWSLKKIHTNILNIQTMHRKISLSNASDLKLIKPDVMNLHLSPSRSMNILEKIFFLKENFDRWQYFLSSGPLLIMESVSSLGESSAIWTILSSCTYEKLC